MTIFIVSEEYANYLRDNFGIKLKELDTALEEKITREVIKELGLPIPLPSIIVGQNIEEVIKITIQKLKEELK